MTQADAATNPIWPSAEYFDQLVRLRDAIGEPIHILELEASDTHLSVRHLGKPYVLLDLLAFPRPDPARGLAPHFLLLDDGRGVNLGRIARISLERPFNPAPSQILYQDQNAVDGLLLRDRQLSKRLIAARSRQIVGQILGKTTEQPIRDQILLEAGSESDLPDPPSR